MFQAMPQAPLVMPRAINKVPIAPSPQTGRSANSSNKLFGFICVIQNRAAGGHKPGTAGSHRINKQSHEITRPHVDWQVA
jgi:hypothetical protein